MQTVQRFGIKMVNLLNRNQNELGINRITKRSEK
jgi:hypothetical protein